MEDENPVLYELYRIKDTEATQKLRYESIDYLGRNNIPIDIKNYELIYKGELNYVSNDDKDYLGFLYRDLILNKPDDFKKHTIAPSDIVALNYNENITFHYFDRTKFKEVKAENYLANAEMSIEGNYNQIDGIINNILKDNKDLDQEKKPSLLKALEKAKENVNKGKDVADEVKKKDLER